MTWSVSDHSILWASFLLPPSLSERLRLHGFNFPSVCVSRRGYDYCASALFVCLFVFSAEGPKLATSQKKQLHPFVRDDHKQCPLRETNLLTRLLWVERQRWPRNEGSASSEPAQPSCFFLQYPVGGLILISP